MEYAEIMSTRIAYWQQRYDPYNKYGQKVVPQKQRKTKRTEKVQQKLLTGLSYLFSFFL